ncbi:hypothetical protein Aduo_015418 [Ancylostoma duodenale]
MVIIALRYLPTDSLQEVLASTIGAREKKVSAQLQKWLDMRIDVSGQTPRPASGTWGFPSIPFSGSTPSYFEMVAISIVVWLVLTAVLEYFRLRRREAERRGPPASTSERGGAAAVAAASAAACSPSPSGRPAAGGQPPHRRGLLAGRPQWEGGQAREEIGSRAGGKVRDRQARLVPGLGSGWQYCKKICTGLDVLAVANAIGAHLRSTLHHTSWPGYCFVKDSGFANGIDIIRPIRNPSSRQDVYYNKWHRMTRLIVKSEFGRWKKRFAKLEKKIRLSIH